MAWGSTRLGVGVMVLGMLAACDLPHQDAVIQGNADGVIISYVGDVAGTVPLARQHCARYERLPLLRQAKDDHAFYSCIRPGGAS